MAAAPRTPPECWALLVLWALAAVFAALAFARRAGWIG